MNHARRINLFMFYFLLGNGMMRFWVMKEDTVKVKEKIIIDLCQVVNWFTLCYFLCVCVRVCVWVYVGVCMRVCVWKCVCMHVLLCMYMCACACIYECVHECMCRSTYVCMCLCVREYVLTCVRHAFMSMDDFQTFPRRFSSLRHTPWQCFESLRQAGFIFLAPWVSPVSASHVLDQRLWDCQGQDI